ncbi:MAG: PaaI family thioesterase [Acidimicrobiia bacterium]
MSTDQLAASMPLMTTLGMNLVGASPEEVAATVDWAEERCTAAGILHGGVLMALADTAGAICAYLNLPPGADTSTIESKTNFFRAVRDGTVRAVARPLHVGSMIVVVQTDLSDDGDRRVAQVTQTQAVLPSR